MNRLGAKLLVSGYYSPLSGTWSPREMADSRPGFKTILFFEEIKNKEIKAKRQLKGKPNPKVQK